MTISKSYEMIAVGPGVVGACSTQCEKAKRVKTLYDNDDNNLYFC